MIRLLGKNRTIRTRFPVATFSSSSAIQSNDKNISTTVLISGAGPTGLFLSHLLKSFGVPFITIDSSPSPPTHPQAHFLNYRSMEILKSTVEPKLYNSIIEASPNIESYRYFRFGYSATSGVSLGKFDHFSTKQFHNLNDNSSADCTHLAQNEFVRLLVKYLNIDNNNSGGGSSSNLFWGRTLLSSSTSRNPKTILSHQTLLDQIIDPQQ